MESVNTYLHPNTSHCKPENDKSFVNDKQFEEKGISVPGYAIHNNRVFAVKNLVSLLEEYTQDTNSDCRINTEDLFELVSKAWVDPIVAVEKWDVIPEPYSVVDEADGFRIRHQAFNAVIPEIYKTTKDLNRALAHLLSGGIIEGKGEFSYKDQFLNLYCPPFPPELPLQPALKTKELTVPAHCTSYLLNTSYEPGFSPLAHSEFNHIRSLELAWRDTSAAVSLFMKCNEIDLWSAATHFHFERMVHSDKHHVHKLDTDVILLRKCYPELDAMSSHSLYNWFGDYQGECRYLGCSSTSHDDGFLRYMLGQLASGGTLRGMSAVEVGTYAAFVYLTGEDPDTALISGLECYNYQRAVDNFSSRTAIIMRFLQSERNLTA